LKELLPVEGGEIRSQVFVVAGDKAEARQVTLGLANPIHFEVIDGLNPGDRVVVVGQNLLRDGVKVSVTD
jgi:multidrug efflux pump subunit AcrA (membrane-fusion protein)